MEGQHVDTTTITTTVTNSNVTLETSNKKERKEEKVESTTLRSILAGAADNDEDDDDEDAVLQTFFEQVWQVNPSLYRAASWRKNKNKRSSIQEKKVENNKKKQNPPLETLIDMGWNGCANLLYSSRHRFNSTKQAEEAEQQQQQYQLDPPLFFQNQTPLPLHTIQDVYSCNPLAAYLDGNSIVLNHAELSSTDNTNNNNNNNSRNDKAPQHLISELCHDLQKSFMHVYANVYVTPPNSQAVQAHADDRDVLVMQIAGKKMWNVWKDVPIPYPYPNEQVGKSSTLPVPTSILSSTPLIQTTLSPGDILYMPRGYVHSASCYGVNDGSYHITIAIPTHDWTYGSLMQEMMKQVLNHDSRLATAMRMSVGRTIGLKRCYLDHVRLLEERFEKEATDEDHGVKERKHKKPKIEKDKNNNNNNNNNKEEEEEEEKQHETEKDLKLLQTRLNQAFQRLQQEVTPFAMMKHLQTKIEMHNQQSLHFQQCRNDNPRTESECTGEHMIKNGGTNIIQQQQQQEDERMERIIGPLAAESVTMTTCIRAAKSEEREWVLLMEEKEEKYSEDGEDDYDDETCTKQQKQPPQKKKRGLTVRDETADTLLSILSHLREHPQVFLSVGEGFSSFLEKGHNYDHEEEEQEEMDTKNNNSTPMLCDDLTLLCFARCCVELGAMAIDSTK